MRGIRGLRLGLVGTAAIAAALLGGVLLSGQALAQSDDTVSISSATAAPGEEDTVDVAANVGAPGLGAWTLDISYDDSVVSVADCDPEQPTTVCNAAFADGVVRVTGASGTGLDDESTLATITFECANAIGSSDLTIDPFTFADATAGDPQDIDPTISNGTFECAVAAAPATGTGFSAESGSGVGWLASLLAAFGALGLAAGYGVLRLRPR